MKKETRQKKPPGIPALLLTSPMAKFSCLIVLPTTEVGCLYENGEEDFKEKITFAKFSLDWLTTGADRL